MSSKKKTKKPSRRSVARNKSGPKKGHTTAGAGSMAGELYKHCVLGPVSGPVMGFGYPDGDARPSVTLDYRRTYVMTPTAGSLSFGLGTAYAGCFIKGVGGCSLSYSIALPRVVDSSGAVTKSLAISSMTTNMQGVVPILDLPNDEVVAAFPAYRPLVAVCDVVFTGSSMMNGGSVTISKTSSASAPAGTLMASTQRQQYTANLVNPVQSATTVVGAARSSYSSRIVPAEPKFTPFMVACTDDSAPTNVPNLTTNMYADGLASATGRYMFAQPDPQAGAVWYSYSGLDSSASITVTVRYCVQYSVDGDSPFVPLAKPSPPPPPTTGWLSSTLSKIVAMPAAVSTAARIAGTLFPSARPALEAAEMLLH